MSKRRRRGLTRADKAASAVPDLLKRDFTAVAPEGPETIFVEADLDDFFEIVQQLNEAAVA